jgi:hypothetical protein
MSRFFNTSKIRRVWLPAIAAALALLPPSQTDGQTLVSPALEAPRPVVQEPRAEIRTIAIYPAAEPDPALRYRFWPAPEDRTADSPTPFVSRAIILALQSTSDKVASKEFADRYNEWSEMPLDQLPREELRRFVSRFGGSALKELARSENFMELDYDLHLEQLNTAEIVQTLLPEFQEMRQLSRLLFLRVRLAVAEQRWQDAVDDVRLGFRLAEVAGHSTDFLIGRLVGFAISGMMMEAVLEATEQPGCPNFYWALASLPENRLFETRDSIEFESVLISRLTSQAKPLPDYPIGAVAARDRIRILAEQVSSTMGSALQGGTSDFGAKMMSGLYVIAMADESRELLATTTDWGERARGLSAPEAVLRASLLNFARVRDGWVKWSMLPEETWSQYKSEQAAAIKDSASMNDPLSALVGLLTPAVDAARRAGRRTLQTRNLLSSIEAIRMHAAQKGELPKSIDNLRPVPAWRDAIALAPFGYHRTSPTTATLTRGERWPGDPESTIKIELKKGND